MAPRKSFENSRGEDRQITSEQLASIPKVSFKRKDKAHFSVVICHFVTLIYAFTSKTLQGFSVRYFYVAVFKCRDCFAT